VTAQDGMKNAGGLPRAPALPLPSAVRF